MKERGRGGARDKCDPDLYVCAPAPTKNLGEACASVAECKGACVSCRAATATDTTTLCLTLGGEGAYCRDWHDCVDDLGCVNNACTAGGRNQVCGEDAQATCRPGYGCADPAGCANFTDRVSCLSQGTCAFDEEGGACTYAEGVCVAIPAAGDACVTGLCGPNLHCENDVCVEDGRIGEACSDVAPCRQDLGLYCCLAEYGVDCGDLNECFAIECEANEDCGAGKYCDDTSETELPTCRDIVTENCVSDAACGPGHVCLPPSAYCGRFTNDPTACNADALCVMTEVVDCHTQCQFINDPTMCETIDGCELDAEEMYCVPTDPSLEDACRAQSTVEGCSAMAGCSPLQICVGRDKPAADEEEPTACFDLLPAGTACDPLGYGYECESATCLTDGTNAKCALAAVEGTDGCEGTHSGD